MPVPSQIAPTASGREIGNLLLSCVQIDNPMAILRAAHWRNALSKVGIGVPFWAVHDLGLLATPDGGEAHIASRRGMAQLELSAELQAAHSEWTELLAELAHSEVMERARGWRLTDELINVLLLKVLAPVWERHLGPGRPPVGVPLPLDPELYEELDPQLGSLFRAHDRTSDLDFLLHVGRERIRLLTSVEQIDLDTLRLLGMFGAEATAGSALGMLDLLQVFTSPDANDVVNFSLDLLPSVLETKRASGQQSFSVDGYAGLSRRGTLDSLMLSELAFDEELFDRRFMENEVFYYAREKQREEDRHLHYILIDATASMRGQRSVFARGLALTLIKKLSLRGEDVLFRFFDSRLYETQQVRTRRVSKNSRINVPYVLCFKGEHGRNYAKVFGLLANEIGRVAKRERRRPIVYLLTHAECHIPLETIERLRTQAQLYGIFMLPSQGSLDLEYISRLHTVQVVDEAALRQKEARARRALDIIDDAAGDERASVVPGARPPRDADAETRSR